MSASIAFRYSLQESLEKFQSLYDKPFYAGSLEGDKKYYQALSIKERACWRGTIEELEGLLRQFNLLFPPEKEDC